MKIYLVLSQNNPVYEDLKKPAKFFPSGKEMQ